MNITTRIRQNAAKRDQLQKQLNPIQTQLKQQIKQALNEGHTINEIAKAAGLSRERCYQIRDGRNK